jgi:endoglucanase
MPRVLTVLVATVLIITGPGALAAEDAGQPDQIINGDFAGSPPRGWWASGVTWSPEGDNACINVPGGLTAYERGIVGQNDLSMQEGEEYEVRFRASSTLPDHDIRVTFQINDGTRGYPWIVEGIAVLGPEEQEFSFTDVAPEDSANANVTVQLGGQPESARVCLRGFSVLGGVIAEEMPEAAKVRVNQVGYLPQAAKYATYVSDEPEPLGWELLDGEDVVASGQTSPFGTDRASRQGVHLIDFSAVTREGEYALRVGDDASYPFRISPDIYRTLAVDALKFFYHQRSGIPIEAEYVGPEYARPAGHDASAAGGGDTAVTCRHDACDYSLDVSGGWYDAGDHGKYVVNGGIAAWQVLWIYERAAAAGGDSPWLADGTLNIPESGNGVPDVLDEARYQVEFLLSMQVPEGEEYAGMAHHKIHDEVWTGMLTMPHQDTERRLLAPPSTAASLNLAAVAAQASRIWAELDPEFAADALTAAERAYAAALENPRRHASSDASSGGGPYNDNRLQDEFFWAASELYVTTGADEYLRDVRESEYFVDGSDALRPGGFEWNRVAALGLIRLATSDALPEADREHVRSIVLSAADRLVEVSETEGYRLPYRPPVMTYSWGSNGQLLNNASVLLAAYDITGEPEYTAVALEAMNYVLGRNAVGISYVTGHGTFYAQNQHHRFWANQLDATRPNPPAGALAGGPNASAAVQDPVSARSLVDCAPQACYIDAHGAYSVNEVTINWNSALAVVAAALADEAADFRDPAVPGGFPWLIVLAAAVTVAVAAVVLLVVRRRRA